MAEGRVVITGPCGLATRLEINDFIKDNKFFTLFIRAIQRVQNMDEIKDKSFFSIAGIHGQPYTAWNGAIGSFVPGKWDFGGYCTHGSVLFPTWHRPYLMLLEQIIQEHAMEIATHFIVEQADWKRAALHLRLPYWDWVSNAVPPDCVVRDETVTVLDFNGKSMKMENPLIRYRFLQSHCDLFEVPFAKWVTTLRHPDSHGKEDINELVQTLLNAQTKIADDTIALLTLVHDWDLFSNHHPHEWSITNSLEAIHDHIHVDIGGSGHMSETSVAAFDPIFYLHHCNLDRLLSIWSTLNGGKGVSVGENDEGGTFTLAPRAGLNENTGLAPFWNSEDTYWCSKQLFNTEKLGYRYPEFTDDAAIQNAAHVTIKKYIEKFPGSIFERSEADNWWHWSVRIRTKKFELGRSFSVLIFLGDVSEDSGHWMSSENLVGVHHVFTNSAVQRCQNCRANASTINEGFIHLNRHLAQLHSQALDPHNLRSYLSENLQWRVIDTCRSPAKLNFLDVTLISVPLVLHPDTRLPHAGKSVYRHDLVSVQAQ